MGMIEKFRIELTGVNATSGRTGGSTRAKKLLESQWDSARRGGRTRSDTCDTLKRTPRVPEFPEQNTWRSNPRSNLMDAEDRLLRTWNKVHRKNERFDTRQFDDG